MSTKTVRVEEDVLDRIKAHKRDDETLSETIERLIDGSSLLDLAGLLTEDEAEDARAAVEATEQAEREKLDRLRAIGDDEA